MFQYAVARALAERTGSPFRLHVPKLRVHRDRMFELGCFALDAPLATLGDFVAFKGGPFAIPLLRRRKHPQAIIERGHNFDPAVLVARPPVYLDGYFQSEKYFAALAGKLRQAFSFTTPPTGR